LFFTVICKLMVTILSNLNRFSQFFSQIICSTVVIKKIPPHLAYVAILPCEALMSETSDYQKIQGSVATYLRRGGVVNNRINKCLLISLSVNKIFKIGKYLAKLRARRWLSRALRAPGRHTAKRWRKCMKQPYTCELFLIIRYLLLLLHASVFTHSVCFIMHLRRLTLNLLTATWLELRWLGCKSYWLLWLTGHWRHDVNLIRFRAACFVFV